MNPTVSILLPVYNGAAYLRESLESILRQTYHDFELIIIDDGSCDDSAQIIQSMNEAESASIGKIIVGWLQL
jgi:glycosyltransferase involved in cell wall biosynthesis